MSSPSDSRPVDLRTARCQKHNKQKSGTVSTSSAPLLTNAAMLSQYKKDNDDESKGGLEVVKNISNAEGVVEKGKVYLESVLNCVIIPSAWCR